MESNKSLAFAIVAMAFLVQSPARAQEYDLVISNGRVIDPETMVDEVANVGILDGRIATITLGGHPKSGQLWPAQNRPVAGYSRRGWCS